MIERRNTAYALLDVKDDAGNGFVKVRAASFLNIDRGREMIVPGTYSKYLDRFSAKGRAFVDHAHATAAKVGRVFGAYEDKSGLVAIARFNSTELGQKTRQMVLEGDLTDVSIGHQVMRDFQASPAEVKKIWETHGYQPTPFDLMQLSKPGKIRVITEADPAEFSFVGIPMNDNAETLEVKSAMPLELKKGAVLSRPNAMALKQAYKLIRNIFKSARIEDIDDEPAANEGKSAEVDTPAVDPVANDTPAAVQTDAELRAKRLRVDLELLSLNLPEPFRAAASVKQASEGNSQQCPVTQV